MLTRAATRPLAALVATLTGLIVIVAALSVAPSVNAAQPGEKSSAGNSNAAAKPGKSKKGRLVLILKAPKGITGQVLVPKVGTGSFLKPSTSAKRTVKVKVRAGSYKVKPLSVMVKNQTWRGEASKPKAKVKGGKKTRVVVKWRKVAQPVRVQVTATTSTSVSLEWMSQAKAGKPKKDKNSPAFVVRRMAGEKAPRSRKDGANVKVAKRAMSVTDSALAANTTYTYAVFARSKHGWTPATSVTTATLPDPTVDPSAASYSLLPNSTVVAPTDTDVVTVSAGQVWVKLAASRPAPVLGAGMAMPVSAALPGGFLGKVAEIAGDGRTVRLQPAGLNEVFSRYDLSTNISKVTDSPPLTAQTPGFARQSARKRGRAAIQPAQPGTTKISESTSKSGLLSGKSGATSPRAREGAGSCLDYSVAQLKVSVDPSLSVTGRFDTHIYSTWGIPHAVSVDTDVAVTATASMDLEVGQELSCFLGVENFITTFTTTPIPMSLMWEAGVTVSAKGAIKVKGLGNTATASFGATARIGTSPGFTPRASVTGGLLNPTGEGSAEASVSLGGEVTVGPGAGTKDLGAIAGIGGTFNLFKASATGAFGGSAGDSCLKVAAETSASIRFYATAWAGPLSVDAEWPLWEGTQPWGSRTWPEGCDTVDPTLGAGDVQATLSWSNSDDMDLHVIDPAGEEIYYAHDTSLSGGWLDRDVIPGCSSADTGHSNIENIYWPTGESPAGTYKVQVVEYNDCSDLDTTWTLTVRVDGAVVLRRTGSGTSPIYSFTNT